MNQPIGLRLEQYTLKRPQEVLLVKVALSHQPDGSETAGDDTDEIAIFRGFSSSLMHPTAFDPDVPMLPDNARIVSIDRLQGPYNPQSPCYIQQGLTWEEMESLLAAVGV